MKGSLMVVAFFCAGCLMGVANDFQFDLHDLSMYVLYALTVSYTHLTLPTILLV